MSSLLDGCADEIVLKLLFQVNTHLTPRPILLTRHGESMDNVRGRIGGDTVIRYVLLVIMTVHFGWLILDKVILFFREVNQVGDIWFASS